MPPARTISACRLLLSLVCGAAVAPPLWSQQVTADSVVERMARLSASGEGLALRRLADSVLASTPTLHRRFGEALYWRATTRPAADSARTDLLRLVVEFPMSARMEDALVRLADGEVRAGDRASARRHLERLVRDHLTTDRGVKGAQQLAQMLFDDGAVLPGCAALDSALAHVSPSNIELTNQLVYSGRRCAQAHEAAPVPSETAHAPRADSPPPPSRTPSRMPARPSPKPTASAKPTVLADRAWTVQVAAYVVRGDALRLEARLKARGYAARIFGDKPYRVRIGRFSSRAEATEIAAKLKAENTSAMIVEAERP